MIDFEEKLRTLAKAQLYVLQSPLRLEDRMMGVKM